MPSPQKSPAEQWVDLQGKIHRDYLMTIRLLLAVAVMAMVVAVVVILFIH